MTPKEFYEKMKELSDEEGFMDSEYVHGNMDDLMCEVLTSLGYGEGVKVFKDTLKWYA